MVVDTRPLPRDGKYAANIVDAGMDLLDLENKLIASGTRNSWPATVLAHMHTVLNAQQAQLHAARRNDKTWDETDGGQFTKDGSGAMRACSLSLPISCTEWP
jgi:hypothetical protein